MDSNQQKGSDIARMIWIVGSPIIFTVGVIGNLMTIIVLSSKRNKNTSSTIFLTFLGIADLILMTIILPRWWLIYMFGFDVRHIHNVVCKVQFFITYFAGCWSASLLSAVTMERTMCTIKPYTVKTLCTVHIAVIISLLLALISCLVHGHILVGMNLHEVTYDKTLEMKAIPFPLDSKEQSINKCSSMEDQVFDSENLLSKMLEKCGRSSLNASSNKRILDNSFTSMKSNGQLNETITLKVCWYDDIRYGQYFSGIHQIVATVCYLIIPETIFFVGGIIIVRTLQRSKNLRMRMRSIYMRNSGFQHLSDNRATQITITLLLVNIVFVFTTSPAYIFLMGRSSWVDEDTGMTTTQEIIWAVVNLMIYINHSINFILYFLSGHRFRNQVMETFRRMTNLRPSRKTSVFVNQIST